MTGTTLMKDDMTPSGKNDLDPAFADKVRQSGVAIDRCYQCLTCTLGCDAAYTMDYPPNQIVRMCQMGFKDRVLGSSSIWVCTACEACVTRCPNEIDIPHLMDTLHQMALREGAPIQVPAVAIFHKVFLAPIKQFGRQFEVMMMGLFMLRARKFSVNDIKANITLGLGMFLRRKLKFIPHRIRDTRAVKEIFRKTMEGGKS
jgi:heterodisulfide reductase subunit C